MSEIQKIEKFKNQKLVNLKLSKKVKNKTKIEY